MSQADSEMLGYAALTRPTMLEVIRPPPPTPLFQRGESVAPLLWNQLIPALQVMPTRVIPAVQVMPTRVKTKPYQTRQTQSCP